MHQRDKQGQRAQDLRNEGGDIHFLIFSPELTNITESKRKLLALIEHWPKHATNLVPGSENADDGSDAGPMFEM